MFPNKKIQISDGWKLKHAFSRYLQKISFEAKTRLVLWELLGFSKNKKQFYSILDCIYVIFR